MNTLNMIGREVEINKAGTVGVFTVQGTSDKMGKLKNGQDAAYTILFDISNSKTFELHPRSAETLFKKGEDSGLKLLPVVEKTTEEVVAAPVVKNEKQDLKDFVLACMNAVLIEDTELTSVEFDNSDKLDNNYPDFSLKYNSAVPVVTVKQVVPKDKKISKKSVAIGIVLKSVAEGKTRKETIALLMTDANLSVHGASTYFYNTTSKQPGWF